MVQLGGRTSASSPGHGSTATSEYFDEAEPSPSWKPGESYQLARTYQNTVLLPDASMVSVGGGVGWPEFTGNEALKQVELWDPVTREWRLGAAQQETRAYHSVATLLPDGRVISAGDNGNAPASGATDSAEVYEPPYLFKGPRPTITDAPSAVNWGQTFGVDTPNTDIDRAVLIAPGAVTHATDMHQRYVPLELEERTGGVDLTAPPNANAAPPGYYMLWLINEAGVPSVAEFVRILPGAAPGRITIEKQTNPADTANPKTSFSFTSDSALGNFSLTDDGTRTGDVPAGTYTVTEGTTGGYALGSIACDDSNSGEDVGTRTATVRVAAGEHVRCVFTNNRVSPCDTPAITGTSPPSPANDNNPEVRGTVSGCGTGTTTVAIYPSNNCTGTPTTGSLADFTGAGITIAVGNNSVTPLSARATNPNGPSGCSNSISYTEDSLAPGAPTITATDPASPSSDNEPEVRGSGAESGSTVRIYSELGLLAAARSARAPPRPSTGRRGSRPPWPRTRRRNLRVTATDAAGNVSGCSSPFAYTEDSQAPAAPTIAATDPASPSSDNQPEVRGAGAEDGSTVRIYSTSDCTGTPIGTGTAATSTAARAGSPRRCRRTRRRTCARRRRTPRGTSRAAPAHSRTPRTRRRRARPRSPPRTPLPRRMTTTRR